MKLLRNSSHQLSLLAVAAVVISAEAQTTTVWNPAANPTSTGLWTEAANWTMNAVPDSTYKVVLNVSGAAACTINVAATANQIVSGDNGPGGSLILASGGSLTTSAIWSAIGYNNPASLTLQSGSSITFGDHLWVGFNAGGVGTLTLDGGTATVNNMFGLGWNGGTGHAEINAGTLRLKNWNNTDSIKGSSILDIAGGQVVITGDRTASIDAFVAAGKITAFGGSGTVERIFDSGANTTTLTANVPEPASLGLLALGLVGVLVLRQSRRA